MRALRVALLLLIVLMIVAAQSVFAAEKRLGMIGNLSAMPEPNIYRRANGDLYLKLNQEFHVKVKLGRNKDNESVWLGAGSVERLNPNEKVEVIQ